MLSPTSYFASPALAAVARPMLIGCRICWHCGGLPF
jgi:hypothetical protein